MTPNEHSPVDDDVFSDDHYSVNNSFESCFEDFSEGFSEHDSFQYDSGENDSHQRNSDWETGDRNSHNGIEFYDEATSLSIFANPGSQTLYLFVAWAVLKSTRLNSIHGHFFIPANNGTFECRVKDGDGLFCGKAVKKTESSDARLNHVITKRAEVHWALDEFRSYQERVKERLGLQNQISVSNYPAVKNTRSNASCGSQKKTPSPAQDSFEESLIQIIAVHGVAFNVIQSNLFKKMCTIQYLTRWLKSRPQKP
ncbi:hypothetical protein BGW38_010147 [Lunasporangiospora selenospora]|uniref:Uncharacterized protein n=1 Tax=Lunasporangiospora selenospora TaxID=979761 RepID=A0A9P6FXD3_9FUNG|nr:hypothetical protein BGW38_010147 [Lunasporangiospora selenospora]